VIFLGRWSALPAPGRRSGFRAQDIIEKTLPYDLVGYTMALHEYTMGSMALYIRDDRVRQLASELAERQGKSVTETVRAALLEAKQRLEQDRAQRDARARAVIEELRAMRRGPVREDVLYDEQGQPRL
jgi:hypothetical protein